MKCSTSLFILKSGYLYRIIPKNPIIKRYITGATVFKKRKEIEAFSKVKNNANTNI
jgi:hypothetical protein